MIRRLRDFRLVPVVLVATICLFALKALGLVLDGGYLFNEAASRMADDVDVTGTISKVQRSEPDPRGALPPARAPAAPRKKSWAQEMFNFPDVTGAVGETKEAPAAAPASAEGAAPAKSEKAAAKPKEPPPTPAGTLVPLERAPSPAERAILERLGERRKELDARARELDTRDGLIKAAEKRLEGRINELKELEARVNNAAQIKDEGEVARFKNLVTMYENMKAKDAAKIFDRLDMRILAEVATQINPRRMSDILAQMSAEAAERLTVELASRSKAKSTTAELPKIEGKPTAN
jgi:flagellar motility protein MotE (MotC chaperone)